MTQLAGFYANFHRSAARLGWPVNPERKLLDFGVGWGRIYRLFLKDIAPGNLVGVDIDPELVETCKSLIPYGSFTRINGHPPLPYEEETFDYLTAYSVFSHLNRPIADAWIEDFARVLKPGGMLYVTLLGRRHLGGFRAYYDEARKADDKLPSRTAADMLAAAQRGEFLYSPSGGGGVRTKDIYGWAVVERGYVEAHWCRHFDLVELIADPSVCRQNILVMRRR